MTKLKALADRIRETQLAAANNASVGKTDNESKELKTSERKEEKRTWHQREKKGNSSGQITTGLMEDIKSLEIDETGGTYIHLRISAQMHSKLMALKLAKVSAQKFGAFALLQLLEHPEIKKNIKKILNDLE